MKRILFYCIWSFLCLHTTINFSEAATIDPTEQILADIDSIISISSNLNNNGSAISNNTSTESKDDESIINLDELLSLDSAPTNVNTNIIPTVSYSQWEQVHHDVMMMGFLWTGSIANYITPAMFIGTPLQTNMNALGYNTDIGATNYSECIRSEMDVSFGENGEMLEENTEDELRNIAKFCAVEHLGKYFEGKKYTTREEMLMLLLTVFGENVSLQGYFDETGFVSNGVETEVPYSNINPTAWFAPYVTLGYDLMMINDDTWEIAKEITNEEIQSMIENYTLGDIVETKYGTYDITFENGLNIKKY